MDIVLDRLWLGHHTSTDFHKFRVSLVDSGGALGPWGSEGIQSQYLVTSERSSVPVSLVHSYPGKWLQVIWGRRTVSVATLQDCSSIEGL